MPHKTKVAVATMVEACKTYIAGESSFTQIASRLGVDRASVRRWVGRYQSEGADGLIPQGRNRSYSPELKFQAVTEYLSGITSVTQLCEKYQIKSPFQLRHWIKQYNSHEEFKPRSGGSRMTKSRKTTQDERKEIVQYCLKHEMNYGKLRKDTRSPTAKSTNG